MINTAVETADFKIVISKIIFIASQEQLIYWYTQLTTSCCAWKAKALLHASHPMPHQALQQLAT